MRGEGLGEEFRLTPFFLKTAKILLASPGAGFYIVNGRSNHRRQVNNMETIFNCSQCDQELSVDASASGSEIECPTCGARITVPVAVAVPEPQTGSMLNTIKTSAAAREEHHFSVPVHEQHLAEQLIQKPSVPLDAAAREAYKLKVKTFRRIDCVEVGHDRFDEIVSSFLNKVGEDKIVSVTPISYTYLDIGSQKLLTDFGILLIHRA
jgi:DNA-directed RNA polymerase subunit RPC12/RpoP